jgi:tetratricopeptide (TPR) repeat protein
MQRRYARVLFSLLLLALASSSTFGQGQIPEKKILSGYIRDEASGHILGEARIELQNAMGTPISFAYSDGNGTYEFDDIPGDCYVSVQHDGYEPVREYIRPDGSGHVYKDILLRPMAGASGSKSLNPISQHELSVPPKAREFFAKGVQLIVDKSDYRGAVAEFARAIAKCPTYYEAYAAMGLAQNRMGDAAAAETALRKSIELSAEKYPQAMVDLAAMFNVQKRFSDAEPLLRKAIAVDASSWRGQFELAVALAGQHRFKEAVTSASAARDLKPENPSIYLLLYNLHIRTEDFPGALHDTESYLKLSPDGATSDRVRRMQEQVQKEVKASDGDPSPFSDAKPAEGPADVSPASASAPVADSNFTPVDGLTVETTAARATAPAKAPTTAAPAPETAPAVASSAPATAPAAAHPSIASTATDSAGPAVASSPAPTPPVAAPPVATSAATVEAPTVSSSKPASSPEPKSVIPMRVDETVPEVAVDVPCSLPTVLHGAGQRAEQLLNTLQKFNASERVEHYKLNAAGVPGPADVRSFDYIVSVSHDAQGGFQMQEYRNGGIVHSEQFPSGIRTANLAEHGLIFHPLLAPGFHFTCEGLGEWKGHPTWLVQFEEKKNDLNPFRSYVINGFSYPLQLTGRAWIDAGTYQVLRLESDLLKPVEKIHLTREHIAIEFASVKFRTGNQQLWLPQTAELYVEWNGRRFYRRHSFSNFKVFSTDSTEEVHGPKESYCFTNTTDLLITGVLNITPVPGKALQPATLTLSIPAKGTVCESVGSGKDVNIPLEAVGFTTFTHDGPAGSVEGDAYLLDPSALAVIPSRNVPVNQNPE